MRKALRRYWFLLPVLASLATECGESPRGAVPSGVANVEIVLTSEPAGEAEDQEEFGNCLDRMGEVGNNVRPSWRGETDPVTLLFVPDRVSLEETSPNRFVADFSDVPADFQNSVTVHDVNECRRNPLGDGRVTMGVTANGTPLTRVVGNDALALVVAADGTVSQ